MDIIDQRLLHRRDECKNLYLELGSFRKVAKQLGGGVTKDNVNLFLEREFPEVIRRKNTLGNPTYFDNIDSHLKAYFLGFIAADGYVNKPEHVNRFLEITIQEGDRIILEKLKDELKASHSISFKPLVNAVRLHIGSTSLVQGIEKHGIYNAKSLTMGNVISYIPEEFKGSFITGMWDGDGCCGVYNRKNTNKKVITLSVVSTLPCIEGLKEYLSIKGSIRHDKRHSPQTFSWSISGRKDVERFFQYTYKQCPFSLPRKYEKFNKVGIL